MNNSAAYDKARATALSDMKRILTEVYDHYIEAINTYVEADEALRLVRSENEDAGI